MKNRSLIKMSIISSTIGIALLYAGAMQMQPHQTPISKINSDFVGLKTKISGQVIDIRPHPDGHIFLKVKDSSGGVISVPIFSDTKNKLEKKIELLDKVKITGKVKNYKGNLELLPERAEDIEIIHTPPVEPSEMSKNKIGEIVKVQGLVASKERVGSGSLLLTIRKNNSALQIFIPRNVVESEGFPRIQRDDTARFAGTLKLYQGKMEIEIDSTYHLSVIEDPR